MPQPLSGPGIGLAIPQNLYPGNLDIYQGELQPNTNTFSLAPGEALPIVPGNFIIDLGKYGSVQYLDPVTNAWTLLRSGDNNDQTITVKSDGFNVRVANLTGCVIGAVVTNGGNGAYVQATTTVTPSAGNSTWQPIIGGAIGTTVSVTASGSGYGIAPLVFIQAPPSPGVQATAIAVLSAGTVSSVTVLNQGAGYPVAPSMAILPNPADPNIATGITNATATCTLTAAGSVTAIICTNSGASVASSTTLTIAGAGASATATPLFLQTITATSVTTAGAGYGTATVLTTVGGYNTVASPAFTNPLFQQYEYVPREANIPLTITTGAVSSATSIVDGGLFLTTPLAQVQTNGLITTVASIALTLGGANTSIRMQQCA